jgi:hypothetical protein
MSLNTMTGKLFRDFDPITSRYYESDPAGPGDIGRRAQLG